MFFLLSDVARTLEKKKFYFGDHRQRVTNSGHSVFARKLTEEATEHYLETPFLSSLDHTRGENCH